MNNIWKEKTCEKCIYRVGRACKRFPPQGQAQYISYPYVGNKNADCFIDACAEYKESD